MTTLPTFTRADVRSWSECPTRGPERLTAVDVLKHEAATVEDRLWIVLREEALPERVLRLFAVGCAERALLGERAAGREPDLRSWAAIDVARRFAHGEATADELDAAMAAALDAARSVTQTAESAALATNRAAKTTAEAAAMSAAMAAERAAEATARASGTATWADALAARAQAFQDVALAALANAPYSEDAAWDAAEVGGLAQGTRARAGAELPGRLPLHRDEVGRDQTDRQRMAGRALEEVGPFGALGGGVMEILIEGVRYVPVTDITVISDVAHLQAVKALVTALYLYGPAERGVNNCIWEALRALSPDVAELTGNDPRAAHEAVEALLERAQEPQTDECPGAGQCHGCMTWCPACGDAVATVCPDHDCDVHNPADEDGVRGGDR